MWLRCCCCCCCKANVDEEDSTVDDSSCLVGQPNHQPFCVPRRHSSFQPSTHNPSVVESGQIHSEGSSSSDEERIPERRGRCWSTIPASDVAAFVTGQRAHNNESPGGKIQFDKHVLSEIAEADQGEESSQTFRVDDSEIYGHISFTTIYDEQEQRLKVFLKQATGIPKKGEEPYTTFAKTSLTSSVKNFRLSRAVKKSLSPVFGEEQVFHISRSKWKSTPSDVHLRVSVLDCDRQGRHDAIGHALLSIDKVGPDMQEHCLPLTPMSLPVRDLGQVLVGLLYSPIQSRLSVHVIKARHLHVDAETHKRHLRPLHKDLIDTFCKVTLTCGGQKVKTCRSRPSAGCAPFYDFRTSFVVPPQYIRDTGTLVSVVVRSALGRVTTLGRAPLIGPYVETGDGIATHWGKMVQEGRSIVQWRNLYL